MCELCILLHLLHVIKRVTYYTCKLWRIPILTDPSECGSCDTKVISLVLDPDNVYTRVTQSLTPVIITSIFTFSSCCYLTEFCSS